MILWDKKVYRVKLHGGYGKILTDPLHGLIQHLMVVPEKKDTVWSIGIIDEENDMIYERIDHVGRLDDKEGLPVGKDKQQKINIKIYDSTSNENFKVVLKIREHI